ncbi:MAG: [FeFe] hydrogenase H-cluster radical SAM maturase HydG [Candidatus Marinimicrobia bacterium]|nr:[FeFe] hydrogenase H-cluster radical SAM maturase HydG [Candidatus Neomarinimicrobiota bacterium]
MKFTPQTYRIPDEAMKPFIDADEIHEFMKRPKPDFTRVREILDRSLNKQRLTLEEVADLVNTDDPVLIDEIKAAARTLKERVYGNRIVLFAPLYIGNKCVNNCKYCGFRIDNSGQIRTTLTETQLVREVEALEENGQKRLILVYGEHPEYNADFIAQTVRTVYSVKKGRGEIRRVNINAAPLDVEGFKTVKASGIGTYQVFQETYHPETYAHYHPSGPKRNFEWRLTSLDRAMEGGIDDLGIGALFGLYDWRYEVLALVRHTNHFEAVYNIGPHTISFPRIKAAAGTEVDPKYLVSDEDFVRLIAILRLAVPYTGMILTAREPERIRREAMTFGVSQIDGGTKLEIGSYAEEKHESQNLNREQFEINDSRSLNEIIDELLDQGYLPSFCTGCYRVGRTGEHFMEFSVPGFIKRYCTPNAMLTLAEYLLDYAPETTAEKGWKVIGENLSRMQDPATEKETRTRLERIRNGERDLFF